MYPGSRMNMSSRRDAASFRSAPVLARHASPRGLRHVTPLVETALKLATVVVLVGVFVVTYTWALAERRRADDWHARAEELRTLVCMYQLRDVERRLPFLASPQPGTPCERLERLGLATTAP
jgi:hypothetical protein